MLIGSRGHKKTLIPDSDKAPVVALVKDNLEKGVLVTISGLVNHFGWNCCYSTVLNTLHRWGLRWGAVTTLHKNGLRDTTLDYVAEFIEWSKAQRESGKPLVVLDESYVHADSQRGKGWTTDQGDVLRTSSVSNKGKLIIIVAAGVYLPDGRDPRWVPGSFTTWHGENKSGDYHGNMNTENFNKWFEGVCYTCKRLYGPCDIIMDGASYHRTRRPQFPKRGDKRDVIIEKLTNLGFEFVPYEANEGLIQKFEQWRVKNDEPQYMSSFIAKTHGHFVKFTPPYHPGLQPIETVWGALKGKVTAMNSEKPASGNVALVMERIKRAASSIRGRQWNGARSRVLKYEDTVMSMIAGVQVGVPEAGDDGGGAAGAAPPAPTEE